MTFKLMSAVMALVILLCAACISISFNRATFTCTGEYVSEVRLGKTRLLSTINIALSFYRNAQVHAVMVGTVEHDGTLSHLSREVTYRYEAMDINNGIYRITPEKIQDTGANTLHSEAADHYLLGMEKEGRLIRIWKITDKVLLIGNPFSPVLSCTKA